MLASRFPRLDAQEALYRTVLDAAGRSPRHVPHARHRRRQGAALHEGRRGRESGARLARDPHRPRPAGAAARCRLRAMLRAAAGRELRVMIPMVSTVAEFAAGAGIAAIASSPSRKHCGRDAAALDRARRDGRGALAALAARRDRGRTPIFSRSAPTICMQYLFAADRDNKRVVRALRSACRRVFCAR